MSLLNEENEKLKKEIIGLLDKIPEIKEGGKKSQRGGGDCEKHGTYLGSSECPTCYINRINKECEARRNKKQKNTERGIRMHTRAKSKQRFQKLKIKTPEGCVEEEYNNQLDALSTGNFSPITETTLFRNIISLGTKLNNHRNKRWWWRLFQIKYFLLEAIFFTLGCYLTYETYWSTIYLAEYLIIFVEASIPSEIKKQQRKDNERAKAEMERSLRRRLREGFQENPQNKITDADRQRINEALTDYANSDKPTLRLPSPPSSSQESQVKNIFGKMNNAMRTAMGELGDAVSTSIDKIEDFGVNSYRYVQDTKDDIGKPITTGGDVFHEMARGFNTIAPMLFAFLFIIYYLKKGRKVWKDDFNTWPEPPDYPPDEPGKGPGKKDRGNDDGAQGQMVLVNEKIEGGKRRRRKTKRKKRRKTRRKSKKRKKRRRRTRRKRRRR